MDALQLPSCSGIQAGCSGGATVKIIVVREISTEGFPFTYGPFRFRLLGDRPIRIPFKGIRTVQVGLVELEIVLVGDISIVADEVHARRSRSHGGDSEVSAVCEAG